MGLYQSILNDYEASGNTYDEFIILSRKMTMDEEDESDNDETRSKKKSKRKKKQEKNWADIVMPCNGEDEIIESVRPSLSL